MTELRIEIDEVRENERCIRLPDQIDRLAHAIGIRLGADLAVDAHAIEDVGDFAEADDLLTCFVNALDDRLASRPNRKILAIRGALEMSLARADKRPGDDATHVVLAAHHLARDRADAPQLLDRNHFFVRRDLKHGVGGRVDDRRAGAHVLLAELVEDHRSRRGLVSQRLASDASFVFGDDLARKALRIRSKRILHDQSHHFPMPRGRVFPRTHLGHTPERAARRLVAGRLWQRVQEAEAREVRQLGALQLQHMSERVGTFVAEFGRVRKLADAEGVADENDRAVHWRNYKFAVRSTLRCSSQILTANREPRTANYVRCSWMSGRLAGAVSPNCTNERKRWRSSFASRFVAPS